MHGHRLLLHGDWMHIFCIIVNCAVKHNKVNLRHASSAEYSLEDDSDLSHTRTATWHKKYQDDNSDLGCTHTATGHRKHRSSQSVAQREEWLAAEQIRDILFFITSSYYACTIPYTSFSLYCIFTLFMYISLLCYYLSFKFRYCCMVEVWGMCLRIAYA